jgi:hypothetical protein
MDKAANTASKKRKTFKHLRRSLMKEVKDANVVVRGKWPRATANS